MDSIISGTYRLLIRGGKPHELYCDDELLKIMDIPDNSDPAGNYLRWEEGIHPDDIPLVNEAVYSAVHNIKSEVKYRWIHKKKGEYTAYTSGMLASKEDGCMTIYGVFKGVPTDRTQLYRFDPNIQLLTSLLSEKMLDSFAFCALSDIETGRLFLLNDFFNTSDTAGCECEFDGWLQNAQEHFHPDDRARFMDTLSRDSLSHGFASSDEVHGEFRIIKDEACIWVNIRCVRMKRRLADKYHEFIVFRRITADHRAVFMEELRNQLINGLAVPFMILDLINLRDDSFYSSDNTNGDYAENFAEIGNYSNALSRFAQGLGCSPENQNSILFNFSVENMIKRFKGGEKVIECEVCRHSGEADEWLRIQAFMTRKDEDGEPYTAVLTVQPINTEKMKELRYQQRLEKALRTESQYKQAILSNAIAVYTFNITTDTIHEEIIEQDGVDPLLPLIGLTVPCSYDEYIRKKSECFTDPAAAETFRKTFCTKTLSDMYNSHRRSFDTEYEFFIGERTGYFREAVILTQDIETGDLWGLTYVRNITDEHDHSKRVEQALRDAFHQAQHANSAKTIFMSQMSHDIRTPLNSILGMSAIAQEHITDSDRVLDCLGKIEAAGQHLLEIVNNVLDLSAIESGKTVLSCEPFDLGEALDETVRMIRPLAENNGQTFTVTIDPGINLAVIGDQTKLRQLLTNVLSNAVKYTPDGGEVQFCAREIEPDHSGVSRYLFTVKDNGIGMKPEFIKQIFDPFVRADDHRVSGIQGTGLGMPISINIARMMNGDISINSEIGKGSVFDITVSLKKDISSGENSHSTSLPKKVRMSDFNFGGKRVLLAEDLEFNAEIASEFLAEANLLTDVAHNGAEAVEMFSRSEPGYYSLIFMDIQMPVLDGNQAAERLRSLDRPDAKTIPIIAMTANAFIEDVKKAKEHGMNGHVSKPLEISALTAALCKWLPEYTKTR